MRIERPLILTQHDRKDAPDAARQHDVQVAPESRHDIGHRRRKLRCHLTMTPPRVLARAVVLLEDRAGEVLSARPPVLRQEVAAKPIEKGTAGCLSIACVSDPGARGWTQGARMSAASIANCG